MHMPKPVHGWRELAGEVGIIVVGVLIALGAEQVVETVHLRNETREALHGIRVELAQASAVFEERNAVQACLNRRLEELGAAVSAARQSHRLPDIGEIGRPPTRPIQSAAWSTATERGLSSKFAEEEQKLLPVHYSQAATYSQDVEGEQEMWATLRLLENAPGPIDGPILAEAVATLERLRYRSWLNGVRADQLFEDATTLRIAPDYFLLSDAGEQFDRGVMLQKVRARPICRPLLVDGKPFTG